MQPDRPEFSSPREKAGGGALPARSVRSLLPRFLLLLPLFLSQWNCADDAAPAVGCACLDRPGADDDDDTGGGIGSWDPWDDVGDDDSGDDDSSEDDSDDDDSGDDDAGDDDSAEVPEDITLFLPPCDGGVITAFVESEIQPPEPDSEGYMVPSPDILQAMEASLDALIAGDYGQALAQASLVQYELCRGEGEEQGTALWRPDRQLVQPGGAPTPASGRALFAWRALGARPLVVEVPHPWFESGTLEQGVAMFHELSARALVVAGTHRCANDSDSVCDGTTGACGGPADTTPYRQSDMAHVEASLFQTIHETLVDTYESDWFLSLHGMGDTGISISDGTQLDTDVGTPVADFGAALMAQFPGVVTTCNAWPGSLWQTRLCGTTNVQGRYVNGVGDACTESADTSSGRFIHLEQDADVRSQVELVVDALDSVLP